jgi:hypothetical protein
MGRLDNKVAITASAQGMGRASEKSRQCNAQPKHECDRFALRAIGGCQYVHL